ncbi:MAG TPA: hypothetical protein VMG10_24140 [Gemmataceae bacterium]|nr:hypothetical protein [Gemmataceae bacterium]
MICLKSLRMPLVFLALSANGLMAQAQTGPSGPVPGPGTPTPPGPINPPAAGRLIAVRIVAFLQNQPGVTARVLQSGNVAVTIRRDGWSYAFNINFSKDGKSLTLECPLGSISQRSPAQLVALLQENDRVVMHNIKYRFTCYKQDQQLYLMAFNFSTDMTEAQVLDNLVRFTRILHDTYESWKLPAVAAVPQ